MKLTGRNFLPVSKVDKLKGDKQNAKSDYNKPAGRDGAGSDRAGSSIVRDAIKEHLARRAWEKRIKANRDDIARGLNRRA